MITTAHLMIARALTRRDWAQRALIAVMIVLTSAVLLMEINVQRVARYPWERYFQESKGVHIWFSSNDKAIFDTVSSLKGIEALNGPYPSLPMNNFLVWNDQREMVGLFGMERELPQVGAPVVIAGHWLEKPGEIVLDANMADEMGILPGRQVVINRGKQSLSFVVAGLVTNPSLLPYPAAQPSRNYILVDDLYTFHPSELGYFWTLGVRLTDAADTDYFLEQVQKQVPDQNWFSTTWKQARDYFTETSRLSRFSLAVFSGFTMLVSGLILANVISGVVVSQVRTIGTLKSVGLTPGQVTSSLLGVYLGIGLAASVTGVALGIALTPLVLEDASRLLKASQVNPAHPLAIGLTVVLVETGIAASVLIPAWRAGQIPPVQAMKGAFSLTREDSRLAQSIGGLPFPVSVRMGFKDAVTRPWRSARTVAALSLGVIALFFSLGMENTIQKAIDNPGVIGLAPYDFLIRALDAPQGDLRRLMEGRPEIQEVIDVAQGQAAAAGSRNLFTYLATGGNPAVLHFAIRQGRIYSGLGEAIISHALADELNLRLNDDVSLNIDGSQLSVNIVGIYVDLENDGRSMAFTLDTLRTALPDAQPTQVAALLQPGASTATLKQYIQANLVGRWSVWEVGNGIRQDTIELRGILLTMAILLLGFGSFSVLLALQLGVQENTRELGILKSVGLTPGQLLQSTLAGSLLLALGSLAVGLPLGWVVTRLLYDALGRSLGGGPGLGVMPSAAGLGVIVLATLLSALAGASLPGWWAARLPVVQALAEE